jgi:Beta-lactamase
VATVDTKYEIGSMTKEVTASAVLQLAQTGRISIDAPLSSYLPDAPFAREVSIRELLTMTSGIPEYLSGPDPGVRINGAEIHVAVCEALFDAIRQRGDGFCPDEGRRRGLHSRPVARRCDGRRTAFRRERERSPYGASRAQHMSCGRNGTLDVAFAGSPV